MQDVTKTTIETGDVEEKTENDISISPRGRGQLPKNTRLVFNAASHVVTLSPEATKSQVPTETSVPVPDVAQVDHEDIKGNEVKETTLDEQTVYQGFFLFWILSSIVRALL